MKVYWYNVTTIILLWQVDAFYTVHCSLVFILVMIHLFIGNYSAIDDGVDSDTIQYYSMIYSMICIDIDYEKYMYSIVYYVIPRILFYVTYYWWYLLFIIEASITILMIILLRCDILVIHSDANSFRLIVNSTIDTFCLQYFKFYSIPVIILWCRVMIIDYLHSMICWNFLIFCDLPAVVRCYACRAPGVFWHARLMTLSC